MVSLSPDISALLVEYDYLAAQQVKVLAARFPILESAECDALFVAREALLEAATKADGRSRFTTFASLVIRRRLLSAVNASQARVQRGQELETTSRPTKDHAALYANLDRLPAKLREAVTLKYGLMGRFLNVQQVAKHMQASVPRTKKRLAEALAILRGLADDDAGF